MTVYDVKDSHPNGQGIPQPGAQGDGVTDDADAIQRAIDAAENAGGGLVLFPPGNYFIGKVILLKSKLTIQGSGVYNTRVFRTLPTLNYSIVFVVQYHPPSSSGPYSDITIQDLTLDGGQTTAPTNPGAVNQCHGIDIRSANRISILNCAIQNCAADGITINAPENPSYVGPPSTEILIRNCSFDTIWRIGISVVEDFRNIEIRQCNFRNWNDFAIKSELHGNSSDDSTLDRGLVVTGCTCLPPTIEGPANAGSISVYSPGAQIIRDVTISHNTFFGTARFRGVYHTSFEGNTVLHAGAVRNAALDLWGDTLDFTARHNKLLVERGLGFRAWSGDADNYPVLAPNRRLVFSFNTVEWISASPPGYDPPPESPPTFEGRAVALHSALDAVVEGNILRGAKPGATAWPVEIPALQVALRNPKHGTTAQPPPPQRITLTQNIAEGYPIGIQLHDPATTFVQTLTDLVVTDNVLDRCVKGIAINRTTLLERLALSGNVVVQAPTGAESLVWAGTPNLPYLLAGVHGADASAVGFFVGQGVPGSSSEARVQSAALGSLYLESTAGELWVREKVGGGGSALTWNKL